MLVGLADNRPLIVALFLAIVRMCRRDVAEAEQEELSAALERRSA